MAFSQCESFTKHELKNFFWRACVPTPPSLPLTLPPLLLFFICHDDLSAQIKMKCQWMPPWSIDFVLQDTKNSCKMWFNACLLFSVLGLGLPGNYRNDPENYRDSQVLDPEMEKQR